MTTKQIDYILELAQTLNFNRAAEKLFISQPTMTYQIKAAEDEIGFKIFERSGKGAMLTPAGTQFCTALRSIRDDLNQAIEQGQNFSAQYQEDITIGLPLRSAIFLLPEAIREFKKIFPAVSITPSFSGLGDADEFLRNRQDILFAMQHDVSHIPDIRILPLFESRIYLIVKNDDPLAEKQLISPDDLEDRTLMVGGGSPPQLKALQQRLISEYHIRHFNSHDHDTTLVNIASDNGVCLAPGFLNDHSGQFTWIPFDCEVSIPCVLCLHENERRESVHSFVDVLRRIYREQQDYLH